MTFAQQALIDGPVFGVDRHEGAGKARSVNGRRRNRHIARNACSRRTSGGHGGIDLRRKRHDQIARDNKAFLVRKSKLLSACERLV